MSKLEILFGLMTIVGLAAAYLVWRSDKKGSGKKEKKC